MNSQDEVAEATRNVKCLLWVGVEPPESGNPGFPVQSSSNGELCHMYPTALKSRNTNSFISSAILCGKKNLHTYDLHWVRTRKKYLQWGEDKRNLM